MFVYTPNKSTLRELKVSKFNRNPDAEYTKLLQVLQKYKMGTVGTNYNLIWVLRKHYPNTNFRSESPVQQVPVNGYLFPVSMFNETKLKD